jgi:hypothetical protein
MDPNSANQWWSKWTFNIYPTSMNRPLSQIKEKFYKFARKGFGTTAEVRVAQYPSTYRVDIIAEGHPCTDMEYVEWMLNQWRKLCKNGFGESTKVDVRTKFLAGSRSDGPAEQLIILPLLQYPPQTR